MKRKTAVCFFIVLILTAGVCVGCDTVFGTSLFAGAQRDTSQLTGDALIESALAQLNSGTLSQEDALAIYNQLQAEAANADPAENPEIFLATADAAIQASGVTQLLDEVPALLGGGGDTPPDPATLLDSINVEVAQDAAANVQAVIDANKESNPDNPYEGIPQTQLQTAGAVSLMAAIEASDDPSSLDLNDPDVASSVELLEAGGLDSESLLGMFGG